MSKKGGAALQKDVPWRATGAAAKPIPKIHLSPLLRLPQNPDTDYALSVMKHPDPIGSGLGQEAIVEAAGPDCIVPGQATPVKLLGVKVWPIDVDLKFLEPVGRELKSIGKVKSFPETPASPSLHLSSTLLGKNCSAYLNRQVLLINSALHNECYIILWEMEDITAYSWGKGRGWILISKHPSLWLDLDC